MTVAYSDFNGLISLVQNESLWLEQALNWDDSLSSVPSEFTLYYFFTTPFFVASHFFIDSQVKLSFLDIILMFESDKSLETREFYDMYIWDITTKFTTRFLPLQFFFYTDNQDFIAMTLQYHPELVKAVDDFITFFWTNGVSHFAPSAVFDLFSDSNLSTLSYFTDHLIIFYLFSLVFLCFLPVFRLTKWSNSLETYLTKLYYYNYGSSRETRLQFEAMVTTFFLFFFYWTMMIAAFDDDQEELIETFDSWCFYFFCFLIVYLVYKYSQHYFAFLEASVTEGRGVSFIAKQFFRDFINTFALLLRFFILLFRLNVYDTLDDFYDSYYIFLGDFDEDEYFSEILLPLGVDYYYDFDVNDDRIYSLEEENDWSFDFFYIYFLTWGKLFTFIFFILEEILRLSLAFYICYLIIFEVHSVNSSYSEDNYFMNKRENRSGSISLDSSYKENNF